MSQTIQNSITYQIVYYIESYSVHENNASSKTALIKANSPESAINMFNQMYHNSVVVEIKRVIDEN